MVKHRGTYELCIAGLETKSQPSPRAIALVLSCQRTVYFPDSPSGQLDLLGV